MKKLIPLFLATILLASCGPSVAKPATTPAALGDFPIGNYRNSVVAWTWDFKADGSYSAGGLQAGENGIFTVTGDQISLQGDYCKDATGLYIWTYDGTALKFEAIHDECTDRAGVVVSGQWTPRP